MSPIGLVFEASDSGFLARSSRLYGVGRGDFVRWVYRRFDVDYIAAESGDID